MLRATRQAGQLPGSGVAVTCQQRSESAGGLWLYLREDWAEDNTGRCKAGIPGEIGFKTKPEIAELAQLRDAGTQLGGVAVASIDDHQIARKGPSHGPTGFARALGGRYAISDLGFATKPTAGPGSHAKGAAMHPMRSPSRSLPWGCVRRRGTRSNGARRHE